MTENPHDDLTADWLERHRFRSLTDLVEQLMPVLEHDEHPYTGEITFSTNHKSEMEGWLVLPMTEADHHLPPGTYTTIEVVEEEHAEALAEVLDQIEANGGRLFPDAVEEGLTVADPAWAEEQVTLQWIIDGEEVSNG